VAASSIIVDDVTTDQRFAPCLVILTSAGVRAVQSMPLLSSSGALVGIVSTHFDVVHRSTGIEVRNLLHAAQMAADALISSRGNGIGHSDRLRGSLELIQQSRKTIERADKLLARGILSRAGC
jgi:GAF domain-containing protein